MKVFIRSQIMFTWFRLKMMQKLKKKLKIRKWEMISGSKWLCCLILVFEHTFWTFSSFLFLRLVMSLVRFLVSSIFFQVFISSCLRRAIRLANSCASRSMLIQIKKLGLPRCVWQEATARSSKHLLFSSLLRISQALHLLLVDRVLVVAHSWIRLLLVCHWLLRSVHII